MTATSIDLNCDLGESFGAWQVTDEQAVVPFIDRANVACGFHAGDPTTILKTLKLAKEHNVAIGAHPSYPDIAGFGRRSMNISDADLHALILYQASAIDGLAQSIGCTMSYIKPHGALYNDMMKDDEVLNSVMQATQSFHGDVALMLQATNRWQSHQAMADALGVAVLFEAFADRAYTDEGLLVPRNQPNAVHDHAGMLKQAQDLIQEGYICSVSGKVLTLKVDTLCVHGDSPDAIEGVKAIRALLSKHAH
ncbi:Uncharacterised protein [BD1-7 clade bacterium]|uniref:Uncharacterized protein n=1 Tax=BD1-7 clade bacterium TaxID=2029982 RepID=A0A5S9N3C5_9GAMM|nr:Uncharacterised protein [BD1-7 clade bacterium]